MAKKVLELSTGSEPDYIVIDGQQYALADPGDFSTVQAVAIRRKGMKLMGVAQRETQHEEVSEEEATEADKALEEIFGIVAPSVPKEIAAKLSRKKKGEVIQAFFLAAGERAQAGTTSASPSSPASSASTAATPSAG